MNANESKIVNNPPPLHLGMLKIDEKRNMMSSRFEIVQRLSEVLISVRLHAFDLHHEFTLGKNVDEILADIFALVRYSKGHLPFSSNPSQSKVSNQRSFMNLPRTQRQVGSKLRKCPRQPWR